MTQFFFDDYADEWAKEQQEKARALALDYRATLSETRDVRKACSIWSIAIDGTKRQYTKELVNTHISRLDALILSMEQDGCPESVYLMAAERVQVVKNFLVLLENRN